MKQNTSMKAQSNSESTKMQHRKRVQRNRRMIYGGMFFVTLGTIISSLVLLHKVNVLEHQLMSYRESAEAEWITIQSTGEAFMYNPDLTDIGKHEDILDDGSLPEDSGLFANGEDAGFDTENKTNRVYLTFDDGPSIYTGQILDILDANDVKATFFVLAKDEEPYVSYYQEILDRGHTLGMHSYTHEYSQIYASLDAFENDVSSLSDFLYEQTGVHPTVYRFPGGSSNEVVSEATMKEYIAYLNEQGIQYYDWNALNGDAVSTELSSEQLIDNIMRGVHKNNTSIVLMHDMQSRHTTVESLQPLIDTLKSEGYELLPIDESTPLIQHVPYNTGFSEAAD